MGAHRTNDSLNSLASASEKPADAMSAGFLFEGLPLTQTLAMCSQSTNRK